MTIRKELFERHINDLSKMVAPIPCLQQENADLKAENARLRDELDKIKEETYFLDKNGIDIKVGDNVRVYTNFNVETHGKFVDYSVHKTAGGYLFSYLCSEKGAVLPKGYTGAFMNDCIPEECCISHDKLIFHPKKRQVNQWEIITSQAIRGGQE